MFSACLINDPSSDPGVYVKFKHRSEAALFDLGEIYRLQPRQILRVKHIFISHTHMDHFIGFDHLLRICLGRDMHISLFGPPGFRKNVEGKLAAYTWNLVWNYTNDFLLRVTEVSETQMTTTNYSCRGGFRPEPGDTGIFDGILTDNNNFTVNAVFLDHKIPSLAFALKEQKHVNIMKNVLEEMGLPRGDWLVDLKDAVRRGDPDDVPVTVRWKGGREETAPLGELKKITRITGGQKISYIADAVYSSDNARKIVELAKDSDIIFIEAPFLEEDSGIATEKYHLTARQAGHLAGIAGAKYIRIFHLSPKYKGREHLLETEALDAFRSSLSENPPA
ncbi:MAG: ribonuclease Z [Deltaproteobacteria bacterium]|nr:ribonuclease Z [Deltaproteobacteria bacterium]